MYFILNYGLFLLKTLTIVAACLLSIAGILALTAKDKAKSMRLGSIKKLNTELNEARTQIEKIILDKKTFKLAQKQHAAEKKENKEVNRPRLFVIDFEGDVRASATPRLRAQITALLTVATARDEIVLRLESGGGLVNNYGLAASQLQRIRDRNIPLTVSVDKVAASGGYMMACVANKVIAAPFAIIGSIGVVTQLPNFHRLLKKHNIDVEQLTAGEYKRTLTLFGENTEKDRQKVQEDLEQLHGLFKSFIAEHRPMVNIEKVATGEYWFGSQAKALNLVDKIQTSDDYLTEFALSKDIFVWEQLQKKSWWKKLSLHAQHWVSCL